MPVCVRDTDIWLTFKQRERQGDEDRRNDGKTTPESRVPLNGTTVESWIPRGVVEAVCKVGQTIPVIVTDRSRHRILHPLCTSTNDTVWPPTDKCCTTYGISYYNLIKIDTGPFIQEFSKHFKVMFLIAQSVRNKALDICDYIMQANVDLVFLCETWLRPVGGEADCAALTPPGFCLKSLPRQSGTGGGLAVLHRTSLTRNIVVSTRYVVFTAFEVCEVRLSYDGHTAVFLSVYRPPPSRQNKLTNAMFLEQFSDLLETLFFFFFVFFVIGFL